MGQFSWLDCITEEQVIDNKRRDVYVLVPKEFRREYGTRIKETCYDGYGNFGGYDIYELVALWNRSFVSADMLEEVPSIEKFGGLYDFEKAELKEKGMSDAEIAELDQKEREQHYQNAIGNFNYEAAKLDEFKIGMSNSKLKAKYGDDYLREIGISIACYDEQNAALKYPIKITHDESAIYEDCKLSLSDPNQGWA